jgi:hypothetical protein
MRPLTLSLALSLRERGLNVCPLSPRERVGGEG